MDKKIWMGVLNCSRYHAEEDIKGKSGDIITHTGPLPFRTPPIYHRASHLVLVKSKGVLGLVHDALASSSMGGMVFGSAGLVSKGLASRLVAIGFD
jgi:hypothetical protein